MVATMTWLPLKIYVSQNVPLVVNTSQYFAHSWIITRFVTRVRRWVPLVEQELFTLPEHLRSPPVFSGVRFTRYLVLCVMFCRSLFVLLYFFFWPLFCLSFDLQILITPSVSLNSPNRQHNGQTKKDKKTNNDLPNITHYTNNKT